MISRNDIQRLLHRPDGGFPVLSTFLEMSVNAENKRTYHVFLAQQRSRFGSLASDRPGHHREAIGAALERIERWIGDEYREENKGVAIYTEIGGDWFEALQFPVPVRNRMVIADAPCITPLAQILETAHHHGVVMVDREHLRMMSVYLGEPLHEHEVKTDPYPVPHDVQRGGYSAPDFQRRKAEETRHFFREFALEVAEFDRRYHPDDLVLVGTDENVKHFLEFLPPALGAKVVHTDHAPIDAPAADVIQRLRPWFDEQTERREQAAAGLVHERVRQGHLAVSGFAPTLEQLQEGRVESVILARDIERPGARCTRCGFYLAETDADCPYCGGSLRHGVDLADAIVRLAAEREVPLQFVPPAALADLGGVAALLRF